MKVQLLILASALALPLAVSAQDGDSYRCTLGSDVRRVQLFHEPGDVVPCEVQYFKDTEAPGERQVLWRALNEAGYCEARMREFVEKLEGLGWQCQPGEATTGEPAAGEVGADDNAAGRKSPLA